MIDSVFVLDQVSSPPARSVESIMCPGRFILVYVVRSGHIIVSSWIRFRAPRRKAATWTRPLSGSSGAWQAGPTTPSRRHSLHPTLSPHSTPHTLHPTLYTLHPTLYTLHPTLFTLHPTLYTLHPTPHTLHPTPHNLPTLHPTHHTPLSTP